MTATTTTDTRWFRESPTDSGLPLLFCLPFAGGGASIYRQWAGLFVGKFHVVAVQLPGRETRVQEDPEIDVPTIAEVIERRAGGRPYAVFGHSMGARIAFEVAHHLEQVGGSAPSLLVLSAARPPHAVAGGPLDRISQLSDARLVARLRRSGSIPDVVLDEPELLDLFLPVLRADFGWVDAAAEAGAGPDSPLEPITIPIVSLAGTFDEVAGFDTVAQWERWTVSQHRSHVVPGGHFFLEEQAEAIRDVVWSGWPAVPGPPPRSEHRAVPAAHHVEVGGARLWQDCMVRTTMLPAEDLDALISLEAAASADAVIAHGPAAVEARRRLEAILAAPTPNIARIAAHPLLREAFAWQNPAMLDTADRLTDSSRPVSRRARREAVIGRYWQRYAAKNETIGFFGPVTWGRLDPDAPHTLAVPGPALCRQRRTRLEGWAIRALADALCGSWEVQDLLIPRRNPLARFDLRAGTAARAPRPPVLLADDEAAVLRAVDGMRTGSEVIDGSGLRAECARSALNRLTQARWVVWPYEVAPDPFAQTRFQQIVEGLPATDATEGVRTAWDRMNAQVAILQDAAGDAEAVRRAGIEVERVFHDITGAAVTRRPGEMYVGRRIVYEDTSRDLDVVIGADVLEPLAEVLVPLRRAARWLCAELEERCARAMEDLCEDLADGSGTVDPGELFFLVIGLLFGPGASIQGGVAAEFADRFARVLQIPDGPVDLVHIDPDDFAGRIDDSFPHRDTVWSAARIHSPDVQVAASSLAAVQRGDAQIVIGEVHAAWATLDVAAFHPFHDDPERLRRGLAHDAGGGRPRISFPPSWPRATTRTSQVLLDVHDTEIVWDDDSGGAPERAVALADLSVRKTGDAWRVFSREGHLNAPVEGWPLVEFFSDLVSVHAVDGFKLIAGGTHVPRVSIGQVTLVRRTWRISVDESGLAEATTPAGRVLAARALRSRMGLPEQVYVAVQGETKPVYCDWRAPVYVQGLATMLRSSRERLGEDATMVISEAFPTPEQTWIPDADGRTYFGEIRMQLVDDEVDHD